MPPRGEIGLYRCLSECWRVGCDVTVCDWSIQRLGRHRVAVGWNSLNLIGSVGHRQGPNGSLADTARKQYCSGGGVGEDMRTKHRCAIVHDYLAGNAARGKVRRAFWIKTRHCRNVVVAQCALQRRSKREHRGPNHGRMVETEEMSNLVCDHRLQVAVSASVSSELHSGIKQDIGVEYLARKARRAAVLVVGADAIRSGGKGDGERAI